MIMAEQQEIPVVPAGPQAPTSMQLKPHRGVVILVLGILGIVCCFICGIIAWVMGNSDLREMAEGRMDPSGRGLTQGGKICGMISVILAIIGFILGIVWSIVVGIVASQRQGM
jgi:hypothetical protein